MTDKVIASDRYSDAQVTSMTTCKAWIPTDSANRYCDQLATHRMQTRWDGVVSVCQIHYEEARGRV